MDLGSLSMSVGSDGLTQCFIFLLVFIAMIWYVTAIHERNLPPGPWIPLTLLRKRQDGHNRLTKLSEKYGPIYSFRIGGSLVVVLNNATLIKEALVDQADVFSERNVPKSVILVNGGVKGSILFSNGEEWRELRRFGSHALRSFGVGKKSLGHKINEEARHLIDAILKHDGMPFDPAHVITNAVSNIICSISFGDRYEYDDPQFQELLHALRYLLSQSPGGLITQIFPYAIYLPPYRKSLQRQVFLRKFILNIVEEHRATLDGNDVRDIIDMFLLEAENENTEKTRSSYLEPTSVWRTIMDLFGAGTDTTSNSLLWAIAIFCHYPEVQEKMFEELKTVVGSERLPDYADRINLPYTEAVIHEIQRFRPVAPLAPHGNKRATTLHGYNIPEGSRLMINLWASHHDPMQWKDPDKFLPERFIGKDKKVLHHEAQIPFSIGRRICLGESLAKMELFLFLSSLVQRFCFSIPEGEALPSLDGILGITLHPQSYKICAKPRI